MQRMGRALTQSGDLPQDDLPKELSGRTVLVAADSRFETVAKSHDPNDWVKCLLMALAYNESRRSQSCGCINARGGALIPECSTCVVVEIARQIVHG